MFPYFHFPYYFLLIYMCVYIYAPSFSQKVYYKKEQDKNKTKKAL